MLKKSYFLIAIICICVSATGQHLTLSDADSKVAFTIKNMGMNVNGFLQGLKGKAYFNPKDLKSSSFDVTVDVATINTNNSRRDNHLKKSDFFDAEKYPVIGIQTTSILAKGNNVYVAKAKLTMHGVTKEIQFDFTANPANNGYQFLAEFSVNRLDYGIGSNSTTMGNPVSVHLNIIAKK